MYIAVKGLDSISATSTITFSIINILLLNYKLNILIKYINKMYYYSYYGYPLIYFTKLFN
jgi:hypothetical protein